MGVGGRFEIGALVPVTAFQTGDDVPGGESRGLYGLGNAKIGAKARILGNGKTGAGLGASLLVVAALGLGWGVHSRHHNPPSRGACSARSRGSNGARA